MEERRQLTPTLELVREIGRGAMGSVWEARNKALGTTVAVKLLRADTVFTTDGEARFQREIEVLATLDHPHLIRIMDRGTSAEGAPFFVMEFLRGEDLGARLAREGTLSVEDTVDIVSQACRGLAVAHARGVVHRDLKPANLFLVADTERPFVKVLDFGIAKQTASELTMTVTGISVGTPYFMSPEQFFTPSKTDHRADVWALGVVAYVCLAGAMPFVGETPSAIGLSAMQRAFTPITSLRSELRPAWDDFFARALEADTTKRFQSALELAEALRAVAKEEGAGATLESAVPPSAMDQALAFAPTAAVAVVDAESAQPSGPGSAEAAASEPEGRAVAPAARGSRAWIAVALVGAAGIGAGAVALATRDPVDAADAPKGGASAAAPPSATAEPSMVVSPSESALVESSASPSASLSAVATLPASASSQASVTAAPARATQAVVRSERLLPVNGVTACWRENEGSIPGTQGSSARIEALVSPAGKAEQVKVVLPTNLYPAFRACAVVRVSEVNYGPGPRETLFMTIALPKVPDAK